jgi:hypothetical protein
VVVIPLVDEWLGNIADVVDLGDGDALVVDPQLDPRPYLAELGQAAGHVRGAVHLELGELEVGA